MSRYHHIHRTITLITVMFTHTAASPLRAAFTANITEILTTPTPALGDTYPAFIEVFYSDTQNPFDLVILDATPGREHRIKQVITITPDPSENFLTFHESDWPEPSPFVSNILPIQSIEPQLGLGFGAGIFSTARRLILYDTTTNWQPGIELTTQQLLEMSPNVHESIVLELIVNGAASVAQIQGVTDDMTLTLDFGQAAFRLLQDGGFSSQFVNGSVNENLQLLDGSPLTPGFSTEQAPLPDTESNTTSMPLPNSAVMGGVVLGFILVFRRGRPPHFRRQSRAVHQTFHSHRLLAA